MTEGEKANVGPGEERRALLFIFITVLMSMIGLGIIFPVMPTLIIDLTGVSVSRAAELGGYLLGVYALMQFLMAPVLGALSDRFGRRRVILTSLFFYAVDYALMALAPTFALLFIGRMFSGAFAATFAAANAFIADISPPEKRSANFGIMGAAFGLGFIIGPAIGGWLGEFGPRVPFFAASAIIAANFLFGLFALPESLPAERRRAFSLRRANPVGGLIAVARYGGVVGVLVAYFLMQIAHQALPAIWAYFTVEKYGWSEAQIGLSLTYVGVTAAFVQGYLIRKIIPAFGEVVATTIGMVAMIVGLIGYAFFAPTGSWIYLWMTISAVSGLMMPGMQGIMSKATPADEQGQLQGAIASLMSLTMAASPLVMTQIFARYTAEDAPVYFPGAPFLLSAISVILALVVFLRFAPKAPTRNPDAAPMGAAAPPPATVEAKAS